jgi:hypothetical protein
MWSVLISQHYLPSVLEFIFPPVQSKRDITPSRLNWLSRIVLFL